MKTMKPVDGRQVVDTMRAELRKLRPMPFVDRSAIESRERLRRIMELVGAKPPEVPEAEPTPLGAMVSLRELSDITGLTKAQLYHDLRKHHLPYIVRKNKHTTESVVSPSIIGTLLELRVVRSHNGGLARTLNDIAS